MMVRYAGHPTAVVLEDVAGKRGKTKIDHLLWGDELKDLDQIDGDFRKVEVKVGEGRVKKTGWMKAAEIQDDPVLEVTFIDIGQGDGCVAVMPDADRSMFVIDAGKGDNMSRYLKFRLGFPSTKRPAVIKGGVISHPDDDHYKGFGKIFAMPGVSFETMYHNGLVERAGTSTLGPLADGTPKIYTDMVKTERRLTSLLETDAATDGTKKAYPAMLRKGLASAAITKFRMLARSDGHVPGYGPNEDVTIEVLGPVVEINDAGKTGLRRLGNDGITKNGHSVVLRLIHGNLRVLLGGDLNVPSEKLLLETTVGEPIPTTKTKREQFMNKARAALEVDVAKSCHHGSADFSSLFLEAVNPIATVISSGDSEAHSHPRAETLGAIGACSRGDRPLIYSTELARSAKEAVRDPRAERRALKKLHTAVLDAQEVASDPALSRTEKTALKKKATAAKRKFSKAVDTQINRTVQTYGAIYLRSDGDRAVIGHRYESNRPGKMWDLNELNPDAAGRLHFASKHAEDH